MLNKKIVTPSAKTNRSLEGEKRWEGSRIQCICLSKMGRSLRLLEKFVSEKLQTITERFVCGFRLLAAQKPVNRPDWWKGKFALFQMPATGGGQGVRVFVNRAWRATYRNRTVISNSHLQIGPQWFDQHYLGCFRYT